MLLRCLLVLLVSTCSMHLFGLDLKPYAGPDAVLAKVDDDRRLACWKRLTVDAYAERGLTDERFDADMRAVLTATCEYLVFGEPRSMSYNATLTTARRLAGKQGSPDPLARWAVFHLIQNRVDYKQVNAACDAFRNAMRTLSPAADGKKRYAAAIGVYAEIYCLSTWNRPKDPDKLAKAVVIAKQVGAMFAQTLIEGDCNDTPTVLLRMADRLKLRHQDLGEPIVAATNAALAQAKLEPWVIAAIKGAVHINNAWAWRGSGWANSVTDEGWAKFASNLKDADGFLEESWRLNPKEPLTAKFGIIVANAGDSTTSSEEWLRRGVSACFDHVALYGAARNFQLPRWGGSYTKMLRLGCDCVETGRFDTEVPANLIACMIEAIRDAKYANEADDLRTAMALPEVSKAVDALATGISARQPARTAEMGWILVAQRWHAGRTDEAKAIAAKLPKDSLTAKIEREFNITAKDVGLAVALEPADTTDKTDKTDKVDF